MLDMQQLRTKVDDRKWIEARKRQEEQLRATEEQLMLEGYPELIPFIETTEGIVHIKLNGIAIVYVHAINGGWSVYAATHFTSLQNLLESLLL